MDFLQYLEIVKKRRPRTIDIYARELNRAKSKGIILEKRILESYVSMTAKGHPAARSTRNWRLSVFRNFCSYLVDEGALAQNPTNNISRFRVHQSPRRCIGADGIQKLLSTLQERPATWQRSRDELIVHLLFHIALRLNEMCSLNLEQVALASQQLWNVERKGGKREDIDLDKKSSQTLESWVQVRPEYSTNALLVSNQGRRLHHRTVQKMLEKLGKEAQVGIHIHPHHLRHESCTEMLNQGVDPLTVQAHMSHESLHTTSAYAHAKAEKVKKARQELSNPQ